MNKSVLNNIPGDAIRLSERLPHYKIQVEAVLEDWLSKATTSPCRLHEAMRYSVFSSGKRIRPVLVYGTGEALGNPLEVLDSAAAAVELIHAYSLIHDDLPAMDNDDLRRGRPTCHKYYDEATAILAGDALQALAFYILACDTKLKVNDTKRVVLIGKIAYSAGSRGMAGGQAIDLEAVGKKLNRDELEMMHKCKTGALIRTSVELGALTVMDVNDSEFADISAYGDAIGLAFQIKDDILDIESDTDTLGKPKGSDQAQNKPTYPELLGLEDSKKIVKQLHQQALEKIKFLGNDATILSDIAEYIINRKY